MARDNTDAVYRCPKGGFHKWGRRKLRWVIIGWFYPAGARFRRVGTRRCTKCGETMGPEGRVDTID